MTDKDFKNKFYTSQKEEYKRLIALDFENIVWIKTPISKQEFDNLSKTEGFVFEPLDEYNDPFGLGYDRWHISLDTLTNFIRSKVNHFLVDKETKTVQYCESHVHGQPRKIQTGKCLHYFICVDDNDNYVLNIRFSQVNICGLNSFYRNFTSVVYCERQRKLEIELYKEYFKKLFNEDL